MDTAFSVLLWIILFILLGVSFQKDRKKTRAALKRAWKLFLNVFPQMIAVFLLVGLSLAIFERETLEKLIGAQSGFGGLLLSSAGGAVFLAPVLVAFPIAAELFRSGAGVVQIAAFISALTTVGVVTLPLEIKCFGKKLAVWRNLLAYLFSVIAALVVGVVFT